ncbi:hypothetical protein DDZ14_06175 [Maritimibacter sp. 55A14]|uniref:hypothetical protein n=1 Tax=Maritimibacter sp. 55A14 TaxID=2174844 RepID=UPI000D60BC8E|nr:hypothetical protein [Maritimibacter sp. 55A14]PWE33362.1 hypothetical protein DDZ14_06175 [Maritimibacter sp. 55A14]
MSAIARISLARGPGWIDIALLLRIGIALAMLLSLHLALTQEINWDEFLYLSQVHSYLRGELTLPLQTVHVHFWAGLPATGGDEIEQIRLARAVLWIGQCGVLWALFRLAREFFDEVPALFTLLVYLSFDYVLVNGTSFRTDTAAVLLLLMSLVLLLGPLSAWRMGLFCFLAALAAMVTVKSVFYAPAFIGLALWRLLRAENRWRVAVRLMVMVAGTFAAFAVLYFAHKASLPGGNSAIAGRMLNDAAKTTLLETQLFPRWGYLYVALSHAPLSGALVAGGIAVVLLGGRNLSGGWRAVPVLLLLALPIGSFVFYRNAFPYFYVFILPTAMLLAGANMAALARVRWLQGLLVILLSVGILRSWHGLPERGLAHQARTITAVHEIFPEPVAYFDRSYTLASFSHTGFFMSSWGMLNYASRGRPVFREALENRTVPLLLVNSPHLLAAVDPDAPQPDATLVEADRVALAESYIPHWGVIWVAGKELDLDDEGTTIEILIPGPYTLESDAPILLDGEVRAPGSVTLLARGAHEVAGQGKATLRWGDHLARPDDPAPAPPFFEGFRPGPKT